MELRALSIAASVALLAAWSGPAPALRQSVTYTAKLDGAAATPPNTEKGTGTATFTIAGNEIRYTITVQGLSGAATAAHIHVGKPGVSGPPVLTLMIKDGAVADGCIDLTTKDACNIKKELGVMPMQLLLVSSDSLKVLLNNGNAYVNVHTAAHRGGEIRGQLAKQ